MRRSAGAAAPAVAAGAEGGGTGTRDVVAAAPPFFVTLLVFLAAAACVVFCFQVFSLVRGGQLSRSWLLFTSGFCVLAISQILVILSGFGFVTNTPYLVPSLLVVMGGLFFYGLWEAKRVLG